MRISKGARARAARPVVARPKVSGFTVIEGVVQNREYAIPHEYPAVVLKDMLRFNERMRHT